MPGARGLTFFRRSPIIKDIEGRGANPVVEVRQYHSLEAFSARALPFLTAREAENNLPIGILERGLREGMDAQWFMAMVSDGQGRDVLMALMTPPHNLILAQSEPCPAALQALTGELMRLNLALPGVIGETALAWAFGRGYAQANGLEAECALEERAYRLDAVVWPRQTGTLRPARVQDLHFLPYWIQDFNREALGQDTPLDAEGLRPVLEMGRYYLLEKSGQPVCLVGATRKTPHGRSVGPVYTPPFFRGRGHAAWATARLSDLLLKQGNDYCVLFADLNNPISNHVYQKIGYRPLSDFAQLRFKEKT